MTEFQYFALTVTTGDYGFGFKNTNSNVTRLPVTMGTFVRFADTSFSGTGTRSAIMEIDGRLAVVLDLSAGPTYNFRLVHNDKGTLTTLGTSPAVAADTNYFLAFSLTGSASGTDIYLYEQGQGNTPIWSTTGVGPAVSFTGQIVQLWAGYSTPNWFQPPSSQQTVTDIVLNGMQAWNAKLTQASTPSVNDLFGADGQVAFNDTAIMGGTWGDPGTFVSTYGYDNPLAPANAGTLYYMVDSRSFGKNASPFAPTVATQQETLRNLAWGELGSAGTSGEFTDVSSASGIQPINTDGNWGLNATGALTFLSASQTGGLGGDPHILCLDGSRLEIYEDGFYRLVDVGNVCANMEVRHGTAKRVWARCLERTWDSGTIRDSERNVITMDDTKSNLRVTVQTERVADCVHATIRPLDGDDDGMPRRREVGGLLVARIEKVSSLTDETPVATRPTASRRKFRRHALVCGMHNPHVVDLAGWRHETLGLPRASVLLLRIGDDINMFGEFCESTGLLLRAQSNGWSAVWSNRDADDLETSMHAVAQICGGGGGGSNGDDDDCTNIALDEFKDCWLGEDVLLRVHGNRCLSVALRGDAAQCRATRGMLAANDPNGTRAVPEKTRNSWYTKNIELEIK